MNTSDAIAIVLELARYNLAPEDELPDEHARQVEACDKVENIARHLKAIRIYCEGVREDFPATASCMNQVLILAGE